MRMIRFYLAILFCLSSQFANASENITTTKIGIAAAAGAVTILSAYSWYSHSTQKSEALNKKHQEKIARLKARTAQAEQSSDENEIGTICYVR